MEAQIPSYEYACEACEATFEELHISVADTKRYEREHPCPACHQPCKRIPSATNFAFKGVAGSDPTSGRSSSGSHDLDYPSLDKAIGRSANRRWKDYLPKKEARDRVRRETGSVAIMDTKDGPRPADDVTLKGREAGLRMFKAAKKDAGG